MTHSKIIRDPVYGYIEVGEEELELVNHHLFQRLRRIRQGLMTSAYPSANHTRFEHSLGVMHLGRQVFDAILESVPIEKVEILKEREMY